MCSFDLQDSTYGITLFLFTQWLRWLFGLNVIRWVTLCTLCGAFLRRNLLFIKQLDVYFAEN